MSSWFDLFVVGFLFLSAIWSYFRGFVKEAFSLTSLFLGYYVAILFYRDGAGLFGQNLGNTALIESASFILIFVTSSIIVTILGSYIRQWLRMSKTIRIADQMSGAAIGVFKGLLILAIVIYPMALLPGIQKDFTENSMAGPPIIWAGEELMMLFAPELAMTVEEANAKSEYFSGRAATKAKFEELLDDLGEEFADKSDFLRKKLGIGIDQKNRS
ncbi:MAG TPA: CvpA family protein [Nitrospinota bacterium]|nr:CvpA family protein [Nitrospinota bacterium]